MLILAVGCTASDPSGPTVDRSAQVEAAIDVLVLDVSDHVVAVESLGELSAVYAAEEAHFGLTVDTLHEVHHWSQKLAQCTDSAGASVDVSALVAARWSGELVAALHRQAMLASTDLAAARAQELFYQRVIRDVVGDMRAAPYATGQQLSCPLGAARAPTVERDDTSGDRRRPDIASEMYVAPEDRTPYQLTPRPPNPMRPLQPWRIPVAHQAAQARAMDDAPDRFGAHRHAPEAASAMESWQGETAGHSRRSQALAHPMVGPMLYHDPTPTRMAPISPEQ